MWPAVIAVRTAVSLKLSAMNTPLRIWGGTGGENHQFFLCKLPIDKLVSMWYNGKGVRRAEGGPDGPNSRPVYPYANFSLNLAGCIWPRIFPKLPRHSELPTGPRI